MLRSRANNSKQLALQQKITLNKVRKSILSRVLNSNFCHKAQLPHTKFICLYHLLSFYEIKAIYQDTLEN